MKRNRFRGALAALAIGALALTCLPTETTTAAFTASADAPGGAVTTATATLPPLSGVQALHDSAGGVILSWDENAFSGDPDRYVIERTVNGVTTLVDGGDGMVREHSAAPPLTTSRAVITQLSAQIYNTCGLAAGDVYCWGNALDEFQPRRIPTRVGGVLADLTVSKVSLGHFFACAIAEGEAYCWGRGMQGQLGHGVFSGSVLPVKVGGALAGKTVTDIAAGREYACAIADARAYCWGAGVDGNLGDGSTLKRASPVAVGGALADADVTHISAGVSTCAIADGDGYCWGDNYYGTVGNGRGGAGRDELLPSTVSRYDALRWGQQFTAIAAGGTHTCAIADGSVYCWGSNLHGQLGDGTQTDDRYPVATDMTGALEGRTVSSLTVGESSSCVLTNDDAAFCWGRNASGALGDQTTTSRSLPTAVTAVTGPIRIIAVGADHACAAVLYVNCWGGSFNLGTGETSGRLTAAPIHTGDLEIASCGTRWRPLHEPRRCGAPIGTEFPGFIDDVRVPGPCASGWLAVPDGLCAPGPAIPVSYRVWYEKGWSSPHAPAVVTWRWWWLWE